MLRFIAKRILRSKIRRDERIHPKKFLPWEAIEKMAIIISPESHLNKSEVDQMISGTKKYVEVYFAEPRSKVASLGDYQCFTKKDRSFLGLPKHQVELALKKKHFDVVINTCNGKNLFAAAIASYLPASFRCAADRGVHDADLIIRTADSSNVSSVLKDIWHYLKMIHV